MTSVLTEVKQSNGHFIAFAPLATSATPLSTLVYTYTPGSGSGASFTVGSFAPSTWANGNLVSTGALYRDMGMTVISANRTFRKVAPVVRASPNDPSPFGASASLTPSFGVSTATDGTALVGFIELGYEGFGVAAPVARFNTL